MNFRKFLKSEKNFLDHLFFEKKYEWNETSKQNFKRKNYQSYSEYIEHQKSKLEKVQNLWLPQYDKKYEKILRERLKKQRIVRPEMSVLCLAARIGTEVKSFISLGCFAVGIDLNPGKDNKYVVSGDFHNLQFANKSVDVVFTNSLDHSFDLDRLFREIKRVMRPQGFFIAEINEGKTDKYSPGYYESVYWEKLDDLLLTIKKYGFKEIARQKFHYPWEGLHIAFKV